MKNIVCVLLLSTPNHGTQRYEESNIKTIKKYNFQSFDELYAKYLVIINEIIEVCNLGFNINKEELKNTIASFFGSLKNVNEESFLKNQLKMNIEDKASDLFKDYHLYKTVFIY
jgi:hypothetical protein